MNKNLTDIICKLEETHSLSCEEYRTLIAERTAESAELLRKKATAAKNTVYGPQILTRGLIEFTNICKNDCLYCGIRKSNKDCNRYRLSKEQILSCCEKGYRLGHRTFVLQGGEDPFFTDEVLCGIVTEIKSQYPGCVVTLSVGERTEESYRALFAAGTDRYLLRHETATETHYALLHTSAQSFRNRMDCLQTLRKIGYVVGAGFMVGSPFQTEDHLAADLKFIETFRPEMCGIGPFIPHKDTPFFSKPAGTADLTCYLLSIIRLIKPDILLPATTALGTVAPNGYELGIKSGANVIMTNISPKQAQKDYSLYDNKICDG